MGRTTTKVKIENFVDIFRASLGEINKDDVRSVEVDAIVDTGASHLCLPPEVIDQLGLLYNNTRRVNTANGNVERRVFSGAIATIMGRGEQVSVMENDATTPPLVGYLVLETLDYVVDPKSQRLIPNPEHGDEWIADMY